jgi:hypothetical protein
MLGPPGCRAAAKIARHAFIRRAAKACFYRKKTQNLHDGYNIMARSSMSGFQWKLRTAICTNFEASGKETTDEWISSFPTRETCRAGLTMNDLDE